MEKKEIRLRSRCIWRLVKEEGTRENKYAYCEKDTDLQPLAEAFLSLTLI